MPQGKIEFVWGEFSNNRYVLLSWGPFRYWIARGARGKGGGGWAGVCTLVEKGEHRAG